MYVVERRNFGKIGARGRITECCEAVKRKRVHWLEGIILLRGAAPTNASEGGGD